MAHRAGNDLARLREAERLGAVVEADVRLWRGRLEVRHLKTIGPVPILWDRWELASPFAPRLELHALLAAARPGTQLMLDGSQPVPPSAAAGEGAPPATATAAARVTSETVILVLI